MRDATKCKKNAVALKSKHSFVLWTIAQRDVALGYKPKYYELAKLALSI
jgi:hypothetical protein